MAKRSPLSLRSDLAAPVESATAPIPRPGEIPVGAFLVSQVRSDISHTVNCGYMVEQLVCCHRGLIPPRCPCESNRSLFVLLLVGQNGKVKFELDNDFKIYTSDTKLSDTKMWHGSTEQSGSRVNPIPLRSSSLILFLMHTY